MVLELENMIEALDLIGADLTAAGARAKLLIVGGGSLLLLGLVDRPTQDIDVIALQENDKFIKALVLPESVSRSLVRVRRVMELPEDWINVEAADVMDHGLPHGFEKRIIRRDFGGLTLFLLGRLDLICLKVHAAVDRDDPKGKHVQDLQKLSPTSKELILAAKWAMTHDPSEGFRYILCKALKHWGVEDAGKWLPE